MAEIDYHNAHAPYTDAVAHALEVAGIEVDGWFADANDPRDSCITLARSKPGRQRVVAWTEEKGWMYGTGPENDSLNAIYGICDGVLPEPAEVVEAVRRCLAGDFSSTDSYTAHLRDSEDDEDGFEERLAAYAKA